MLSLWSEIAFTGDVGFDNEEVEEVAGRVFATSLMGGNADVELDFGIAFEESCERIFLR